MAAQTKQTRFGGDSAGAILAGRGGLQEVMAAAPSWLGSAVIHVVILLLLCQIPWEMRGQEDKPIDVKIVEKTPEPTRTAEMIKPPEPHSQPVLTDWPLPDFEIPLDPRGREKTDQPDVDPPSFAIDVERRQEPPLQIARLALGCNGPTGHIHRMFVNRGDGGRRRALIRYDGSWLGETKVRKGLGWLARAQEPDGHWDSRKWGANHNCDAAVTGLALFAFLAHGEVERHSQYWSNVHRALVWLEKNQQPSGGWPGNFYTHGICTMAVSEAYGLTHNPRWRAVAQKGISFCCANQNPHGGWDYAGSNPRKVDTSVTGWVVMALKSGAASGLDVPQEAIELVRNWLRASVNADGTTGYAHQPGGRGSSGGNTAALTAAATLCRQFMGWRRDDDDLARALNYVSRQGVKLGNMYHTYYGTLATFQAGGTLWEKWNKAFHDALIGKQVTGRGPQFDGSWDTDITYGKQGGRVYSTAMSVLCLEVYYSYLPMLKRSET